MYTPQPHYTTQERKREAAVGYVLNHFRWMAATMANTGGFF
jgi:hypothetical protein